jgi:hypothetical protein
MNAPHPYGKSWFVECPKCLAKKHRRCINLAHTKVSQHNQGPHDERRDAAKDREG